MSNELLMRSEIEGLIRVMVGTVPIVIMQDCVKRWRGEND
jgi:hypothetical protein